MKNYTLVSFLTYFKETMRDSNVNYIEHIISGDDRDLLTIDSLVELFASNVAGNNKIIGFSELDSTDKRRLTALSKKDNKIDNTIKKALEINKNVKSIKNEMVFIDDDSLEQLRRVTKYFTLLQSGISPSASLIFRNGEIWNIEITSSERSDRTLGLEARLSKYMSSKNYLIVEEYGKKGRTFSRPITDPRHNLKVVSKEEFIDELMWQIYRYNNKKNWGESGVLLDEKNRKSVINSHRGNHWEKLMEKTLTDIGFMTNIYDVIIAKLAEDEKVDVSDITIIDAKQIPGTVKSDFEIEYSVMGKTAQKVGVSMKASGEDNVSVHQTKATDLISGLGIADKNIERAILDFEKAGSSRGLNANQIKMLENYFANQRNYDAFISWIFTRGGGTPVKYILLHSYNVDLCKACCHTRIEKIEDYMSVIKSKASMAKKVKRGEASFGTGISWTYHSSTKEIQFKTPFLFE